MKLTPQNFVIIGALPRSGTAWLATALNLSSDIIAFHEGAMTEQNYTKRMEHALDCGYKCVVDVTTNLNPTFDHLPATRFFLHRNPGCCLKSAARKFGPEAYDAWTAAHQMMDAWKAKHEPVIFKYDDMVGNREGRGRIIQAVCSVFGPYTVSPRKLDQLAAMNVQMHDLKPGFFHDKVIQTVP